MISTPAPPVLTPECVHMSLSSLSPASPTFATLQIPTEAPALTSSFDDLLASAELPPPGPAYFEARRVLWLTPRSTPMPQTLDSSTSRSRLENLLEPKNAAFDNKVWLSGIQKVWKGLNAGGRLKRRLPLALLVKIIYSAWLRDDTWPAGAVVPDSDEPLQNQLPKH